MLDKAKWDTLIDQKGKAQDDIYRAEEALRESAETAAGLPKAPPPDPEKLRVLDDARQRLAAIDEAIKTELGTQVE